MPIKSEGFQRIFSAKFSLLLGDLGAFDCRISQLPTRELVLDYFRWRMEDAARNALNSHCYWLLRKQGQTLTQATKTLEGMSVSAKNELLFNSGINFNTLPNWQKRGVGVYWETYTKTGHNPITQADVTTERRRLTTQLDLPMKDDYGRLIGELLDNMDS